MEYYKIFSPTFTEKLREGREFKLPEKQGRNIICANPVTALDIDRILLTGEKQLSIPCIVVPKEKPNSSLTTPQGEVLFVDRVIIKRVLSLEEYMDLAQEHFEVVINQSSIQEIRAGKHYVNKANLLAMQDGATVFASAPGSALGVAGTETTLISHEKECTLYDNGVAYELISGGFGTHILTRGEDCIVSALGRRSHIFSRAHDQLLLIQGDRTSVISSGRNNRIKCISEYVDLISTSDGTVFESYGRNASIFASEGSTILASGPETTIIAGNRAKITAYSNKNKIICGANSHVYCLGEDCEIICGKNSVLKLQGPRTRVCAGADSLLQLGVWIDGEHQSDFKTKIDCKTYKQNVLYEIDSDGKLRQKDRGDLANHEI